MYNYIYKDRLFGRKEKKRAKERERESERDKASKRERYADAHLNISAKVVLRWEQDS